jgi:acetolactate synthase-1/2/3 large subunit
VWLLQSLGAAGVRPPSDGLASHRLVLDRLLENGPPRAWQDPFADIRNRRRLIADGEGQSAADCVPPQSIVKALARALPGETIVTTDVGSHKYLFGQFWPSRHPETFWMSNGLSGMGYGLPAAIAAKLARPEAPVLAALGDGAFSMNSQELETAHRTGVQLIVVVLADHSYSLIKIAQEARELPTFGVDFDPIDTVAVATACGVRGVRAETENDIERAATEAQRNDESIVIEVPVDPHAYKTLV